MMDESDAALEAPYLEQDYGHETQPTAQKVCRWDIVYDSPWSTSCGNSVDSFFADGVCPHCGCKVEVE